jgi:hypothetical protein
MLPHHHISARISDAGSSCAGDKYLLENYFSYDSTKQEILTKRKRYEKEWVDIPLELPAVSVAQAKKDFRRQKINLNEVAFTPELNSTNNNDLFASSIYNLCEILTRLYPMEGGDPKATDIAESVMQRSCRSGTGADSFFAVHQLFSVKDTIVTQHENESHTTIDISLFASDGSVWARCDCKNSYTLVDISQLGEDTGEETADGMPLPWLYVDTYIRDDTNFSTGYHNRALTIVTSKNQIEGRSCRPSVAAARRRSSAGSATSNISDLDQSDRDDMSVGSYTSVSRSSMEQIFGKQTM